MTGASPSAGATGGYRPHLDGIRAVAVVLVILFHLGYTWVPGGFAGVDVFFVLSGYLITGLLVTDVATHGAVRLRRFYARRVRRLLPASLAVLATVLVLGGWLFDPVQRHALGGDTAFAALYGANWHFATATGGYFQAGQVPSPLVHYWSLAVEEQFYLVWPAMVVALHRFARWRRRDVLATMLVGVVVLIAASAVASVALAGSSLTYYGTHTRAYQLLSGGALALAVRRWGWRLPDSRGGRASAGLVTTGSLALLVVLAHAVPDASHYPGWPGLAVTVASLGLIVGLDLAPARSTAASLLGHRSLATVGRLSYSLYIWHWPLIVFLPLVAARADGLGWLGHRPAVIAVVIVAATGSYLVIERPVRFRVRISAPAWRVVALGLAGSLLTGGVAAAVFRPNTAFQRKAFAAVRDLAKPGDCPYFADDWPSAADSEPCVWRKGTGPVIALVGDSHAQQWQPALDVLARDDDATIVRATRGGCAANDVTSSFKNESGRLEVDTACTEWRRSVFPKLVDEYDPDIVIVATRSQVDGIKTADGNVFPSEGSHVDLWAHGWDWTLQTLGAGGAQVVVTTIGPTLPTRIPACLADHGEHTTACDYPVTVDPDVVPYNDAIDDLDDEPWVAVVDPRSIACPGGECPAIIDDVIVHRDDNHLSATFVRDHAREFGQLLANAGVDL